LYGIPVDSLYQLLDQTRTNPQELLTTHLQLANALSKQGNNSKANKHVETVEKQLAERNFPFIKVHLLLTKGLLAYNQYKDEEALVLFEKGYKLNQQYQAGFCVDFCINLAKVTPLLESKNYIKKGLDCASNVRDTIALQKQLGNIYTQQEQYTKAIELYTRNQQLAQNIKNTLLESNAYQDIGNTYLREGKFKQAANSYLESAKLKEKIGDQQGLVDVQHNLAMVYLNQERYDKSLEYYQKCETYYNSNKDTAELLEIWSNIASVYIAQTKYDTATIRLNQVLVLLEQFPNPTVALKVQMNLGDIQLKKENYSAALALFEASLKTAQQQDDYFNLLTIYNFMGVVYRALQDYEQSISYYNKALTLSRKLNILDEQHLALFGLYKSYEAQGKTSQALDWHKQYVVIKDSLYNVETTTMLEQYDNLQKQKEIETLKANNEKIALEKQLQTKQIYLLLLGMGLLLVALALLWLRRRHQQKALQHQQKIEQLMHEHNIKILSVVVEAQYKEQKRVAREIHDNIGSLLSTLMRQHEAGEPLAIHTPYYEKYQLVEELIASTSKEVKMLASDMSNGKQLNFDLEEATKELVERIRNIEKFELELAGIGNELDLPPEIELLLYRLAQELLNNILKHAQAKHVVLQINQYESEVILMAEDDGRGFDPDKASEGLGLKSIRERIAPLGGTLDIDTNLTVGTTMIITIPLD
jgi:signal transduction histidine kinase